MGKMIGKGEHGGQWWIPMPNQTDGSPPPAGTPDYLVNVNGGATYEWGDCTCSSPAFIVVVVF